MGIDPSRSPGSRRSRGSASTPVARRSSSLARALDLARLRPRDAADRLRPPARPAGREGRRAAPGADRGARAAHGRAGGSRERAVRPADDKDAEPTRISARFTIAADGAASRFAKPAGVRRDDSRPLGIAARRYYRTPYHPGPWFESWLDLWEGDMLLPGYGWLFPVDGRPDQPGRRAPQHLQGLQAGLGAAAVRRVRDDAARPSGRSTRSTPRAACSRVRSR